MGEERFNVFTGCPHAQTATIVLRGGSEQFIEESHRSVHDALCIVKRGLMGRQVVAGGGAIEMDVSKALRDYALTISGKQQHIVNAFAKALEVVPKQLCENAGFDPTNVLQQLRKVIRSNKGGRVERCREHFGPCLSLVQTKQFI